LPVGEQSRDRRINDQGSLIDHSVVQRTSFVVTGVISLDDGTAQACFNLSMVAVCISFSLEFLYWQSTLRYQPARVKIASRRARRRQQRYRSKQGLPCSAGQLYSYTTSLAKPAGTASDGLWYRTVHPPGPLHVDDWRTSGVVILIEVCRA
jgi:hypothetical protein